MMNKQRIVRGFAISTISLLGVLLSSSISADPGGRRAGELGSLGPVPKAECGLSDRTESGLQGQTTLAERVSGLSELGFNCNLELVGEFNGEGAKYQMTWFDDCAYYGTLGSPAPSPLLQHHGVVVVDASDPRHPQASSYLDTPRCWTRTSP